MLKQLDIADSSRLILCLRLFSANQDLAWPACKEWKKKKASFSSIEYDWAQQRCLNRFNLCWRIRPSGKRLFWAVEIVLFWVFLQSEAGSHYANAEGTQTRTVIDSHVNMASMSITFLVSTDSFPKLIFAYMHFNLLWYIAADLTIIL